MLNRGQKIKGGLFRRENHLFTFARLLEPEKRRQKTLQEDGFSVALPTPKRKSFHEANEACKDDLFRSAFQQIVPAVVDGEVMTIDDNRARDTISDVKQLNAQSWLDSSPVESSREGS